MVDFPQGFRGDNDISDLTNFKDQSGDLKGVVVRKMRLGDPDATGRRTPEEVDGSDYIEQADLVIEALGFEPEDLPKMWVHPELTVSSW